MTRKFDLQMRKLYSMEPYIHPSEYIDDYDILMAESIQESHNNSHFVDKHLLRHLNRLFKKLIKN